MNHRRTFIGSYRVVSEVNLEPLLSRRCLIHQLFCAICDQFALISRRSRVVAELAFKFAICLERFNNRRREGIKVLHLATINSLLRGLDNIASGIHVVTTIHRLAIGAFPLSANPLTYALIVNRRLIQGAVFGGRDLDPANASLRVGLDHVLTIGDLNGDLRQLICAIGNPLRRAVVNDGRQIRGRKFEVSPTQHASGLAKG